MRTAPLPWQLLAASLLIQACAAALPAQQLPRRLPIPTSAKYMASVDVADITPALHLSLFGHGPESRIATGVRLRLRCEIFVIAAEGSAVALVPCDLNSPSRALQRAVSDRLEKIGVPIGPEALFIMATHTHAGPAHYHDARRYSGTLSSSAPGYDQQVVDFLADRIAGKIAAAYGSLEPVCLSWRSQRLTGLTFNRSYVPFLANKDIDAVTRAREAEKTVQNWLAPHNEASNDPGRSAPALRGPEEAVDPLLSLLRISRRRKDDSCEPAPIGVFAVYGMHPTGVPNTNDLYHGDIFGFAVRAAEGRLSTYGDRPDGNTWASESAPPVDERKHVIVGLANGIEGDVSPKLALQSFASARNHGLLLGHAIEKLALVESATANVDASAVTIGPMVSQGRLDVASWDLRFPNADVGDGRRLCEFAELGVAAGGGARDGPTRLRVLPEANEGYRLKAPYGCHGRKLPLRTGAHDDYGFPDVAPIGLIRVADGVIATAPGEMTTVVGQRIRAAISRTLGTSEQPPSVAMVGLTNQYMQYFTTENEYPYQYYEGASNLYGALTAKFLEHSFIQLAATLQPPSSTRRIRLVPFHPKPSPCVDRWPADTEPSDAALLSEPKAKAIEADETDGLVLMLDALPLTFTSDRDHFSIQVLERVKGRDVVVDDDRGSSIEVRELGDKWRIRWLPDIQPDDARCGKSYKLAIRGRLELTTQPIKLSCKPR